MSLQEKDFFHVYEALRTDEQKVYVNAYRVKRGPASYLFKHDKFTHVEWSLFQVTMENIGFLSGDGGCGLVLLNKLHCYDVNRILKQIPVKYGIRLILFQYLHAKFSITNDGWKTIQSVFFCKLREGFIETPNQLKKRYYFRRVDGCKFSFSTTAEMYCAMQASLQMHGVVKKKAYRSVIRNTSEMFALHNYYFPSKQSVFVEKARQKVFSSWIRKQKVSFSKLQVFGVDDERLEEYCNLCNILYSHCLSCFSSIQIAGKRVLRM